MFGLYTDRARRVVNLAEEEARMLHDDYISTEHILLGLVRESKGVAAQALKSFGISPEAVRNEVEDITGPKKQAPSGHASFTPRAKTVFELAHQEATALGQHYIGTEHILLGLISEGAGVATQVLVRLHVTLDRLRQQVIQMLRDHER